MGAGWKLSAAAPVAGQHYPASQWDYEAWFDSEEAACEYFAAVRWREGWECPRCGAPGTGAASKPNRWWCGSCRHHISLTTGTSLHNSKLPTRTWLAAAWHVTATKAGMSAVSLSRTLGVSYESAWLMLHKMREVMTQKGRDRLFGDIEIDETYLGGRDPGNPGRSRNKKTLVAIAVELEPSGGLGRIRVARIPDASGLALADFIEAHIEPGSWLLPDAWEGYPSAVRVLKSRGHVYGIKATNHSQSTAMAHVLQPHVHRVASLLKRWLLSTHQGAVDVPHLDAYLSEYVFRFNRRKSNSRGLLFWRLVCALAENTTPTTEETVRTRRAGLKAADKKHAATNAALLRARAEAVSRGRAAAKKAGLPYQPPDEDPILTEILPEQPF